MDWCWAVVKKLIIEGELILTDIELNLMQEIKAIINIDHLILGWNWKWQI